MHESEPMRVEAIRIAQDIERLRNEASILTFNQDRDNYPTKWLIEDRVFMTETRSSWMFSYIGALGVGVSDTSFTLIQEKPTEDKRKVLRLPGDIYTVIEINGETDQDESVGQAYYIGQDGSVIKTVEIPEERVKENDDVIPGAFIGYQHVVDKNGVTPGDFEKFGVIIFKYRQILGLPGITL